ncbi:prepilin peptidase dependent protein B [Bisgaardia hudsonensis]|uniref:Prepilin peptidase dependent protein B n=1 Tax=Bisgaardia hudsonensis TaxID=109472 RepID=A0A4R2N2A5_9PAST|nr:hypothetical protein [Bisgaardia hudsonensis]QLB12448.1 hypothetical protein A6A11_01915 [Bisgaardia hudsonensis]TCP13983.1 prepilin peptidase dependent protein B [Bisgaardia hudsonensis]
MIIGKIYRGQTLLSLILSLSLSSILLFIIISFYTQTEHQNKKIFSKLYLQSELQRTVQLIAKDLRRSGFRAISDKIKVDNLSYFEKNNPYSVTIGQLATETQNSCVIFFYDLNATGCIGTTYTQGLCIKEGKNSTKEIESELFGYRLNKNMIETRSAYKNSVSQQCTSSQCFKYLQASACDSSGWIDLLDDNEIAISTLNFSWLIEGKAIEVSLEGYLKSSPDIRYETSSIIPILNNIIWTENNESN